MTRSARTRLALGSVLAVALGWTSWGLAQTPPARAPEGPSEFASHPSPSITLEPAIDPASGKQIETLPPPRPAGPDPAPATPGVKEPLYLDEVIASVEGYYPLLVAAEQERVIAGGQFLSAQGAFDLNLRTFGSGQTGTYDNQRFNIGVDQPLPVLGGATGYAGYRLGYGDWPSYYQYNNTADGGEFRAGLLLPVLRDAFIDRRRATLAQAEITRLMADPSVRAQQLIFIRNASRAYWNWVAADRRYDVARRLLEIAEERIQLLQKQLDAGAIRPVEFTDNQRAVIDRRAREVTFRRRFEQASIELSLFYRDRNGMPLRADVFKESPGFPDPQQPLVEKLTDDVQLALRQRPELRRLDLLRRRFGVDLRLAENQKLPGVGLSLTGAQDIGAGKKDLDRTTYEAILQVDMPLQLRDARGRIQTAQGNIAQVSAQERYQRDVIVAEVNDAMSGLVRAYELLGQARENVTLARRLAELERKAFPDRSTQFQINLRELAQADAENLQIDAQFEFFRALADYRAALGLGLPPEPPVDLPEGKKCW